MLLNRPGGKAACLARGIQKLRLDQVCPLWRRRRHDDLVRQDRASPGGKTGTHAL
jgi:hypothetical protein